MHVFVRDWNLCNQHIFPEILNDPETPLICFINRKKYSQHGIFHHYNIKCILLINLLALILQLISTIS